MQLTVNGFDYKDRRKDKAKTGMAPQVLQLLKDEFVKKFREQVVKDISGTEVPDLLTLEEWAREITIELGQSMVQEFVNVRSEQIDKQKIVCDKCNKPMKRHRKSTWTRNTPFGAVNVEDDVYAYCANCKDSFHPLHSYLGTKRETWSLLIQEAAVDLATDESCQSAVEKLERHHPEVKMNRSTALHLLHQHGAQAREFTALKLHDALSAAVSETNGAVELEVEYDGGMIPVATLQPIENTDGIEVKKTPIRGLPKRKKDCHWEEVKVGLVQVPGEQNRLYSVRPTAELEEAFKDLLSLACLKKWTNETKVRGIADGARYIRTRMEKTFHSCSFRFILDRPHAKEHLSNAGEALKPLIDISVQEWASNALSLIEKGNVDLVINELRDVYKKTNNDVLRKEADYFERNRDAVTYTEFRENGWSTASSEIESAHRHVVQLRLKIPGAWWHPDKVKNILALRMLKANGWWNEYWQNKRKNWSEQAVQLTKRRNLLQ